MFLTIFLTVWTVMHLYVFWRLSSVPFVAQHFSPILLTIIGAILWSTFLLPRFFNNRVINAIATPLDIFGENWLGVLFLLFCSLLFFDIVSGFGLLLPQYAAKIRSLALLIGILLSVIAFIQGLRPPVISDYDINIPNLPPEADGMVVAVISDLHLGVTIGPGWLKARVEQINALNPDLIVMVGDIVEGHDGAAQRQEIKRLMGEFKAPFGVWGVTGNHEGHGSAEAAVSFLEDSGIHILRNEWRELRPGLIIAGIDDRGYGREVVSRSDRVKEALANRPLDAATIFLSHRPEAMEEAAAAGAGLMLCGHTHAGQIWPFTYVAASMNPLLAGKYEIAGMPVIVSRGAGTWGPRMRLWQPGELLRITLRAAKPGN